MVIRIIFATIIFHVLFAAADYQDQSVQFCEDCNFHIGGLFPIHAPKSRDNTYNYFSKLDQQNQQKHENYFQTFHYTTPPMTTNNPQNEEEGMRQSNTCGEIKKERGIQRLEAMLYAIDLINNSTSLLKDIKLGAKIYDTCDRDTVALEKCIQFIGDHFILNKQNYENDFICKSDEFNASSILPVKNEQEIYKRKVVGVIGAASSSVSVQVANILRLFEVAIFLFFFFFVLKIFFLMKIPQISYASTSPELSDRERFPYFSRVLPSDTLQAEAMSILVKSLNWNYVATINEEGNHGGIEAFIANAKNESKKKS